MKTLKMIALTILMIAAVSAALTGCQSTAMYSNAKELNDSTFDLGMNRVCGVTASLAASRKLSPAAQQYRTVLCQYWVLETTPATTPVTK